MSKLKRFLFKIYFDFNYIGFNYLICVVKKKEIIFMKVLLLFLI